MDAGAILLPIIPGDAGTAIKAARGANKAIDAVNAGSKIDKVVDATKSGRYGELIDSKSVGEGKNFTQVQKQKILEANKNRNGSVLKSDLSGQTLDMPVKSQKGEKTNMNQTEIDHINPKSKGGTNSFSNAQVLSKEENLKKVIKYIRL